MKRNHNQWAARAAHLLLCGAAISVPVKAQQAPPNADAFAVAATPKSNYGPSPLLPVTSGATSFIQFNLSGVPANATVSKATVRLYVDAVTGSGAFDLYELDTPWTEGSLNFANAPTPGLSATGAKPVSISSANCNQFVLVDITTLVQEWLNGTVANHGIAIKLTSPGGGFSFDSKESLLTSHEPELEVTLATAGAAGPQGVAGATGPAGPQGPQGPQGLPGNWILAHLSICRTARPRRRAPASTSTATGPLVADAGGRNGEQHQWLPGWREDGAQRQSGAEERCDWRRRGQCGDDGRQ